MPPTFALHSLGWHAFQQLCHTVLREVLGQTVVSFLDVRDGGRDGAFVGQWRPDPSTDLAGEFVVQCKHTARAGYNLRLSELRDEFAKAGGLVRAGRCDTYVLMTNAGVSGSIENEIVAELQRNGVKHSRVLGSTWLNQTIVETPRLRRLVPRLYGLGDLTQILDERAYRQAAAVLDAMRVDLAKLVLTGTYTTAVEALYDYGFVLLLGEAATGKTTIAAQLALGAADADDDDFSASVVKLDTIGDLQDRWNPDEPQLIWLDDAFGSTQFERTLAGEWTRSIPRISGAIDSGTKFVVTSRDYVFQAARRFLKPGALPLMNEAQVVVDVADLTGEERRQILYNHLRHGRQPAEFLELLQPHLEMAADHPGYSPELARRLAEPVFTANMGRPNEFTVSDFFGRPAEFLQDVIDGLDDDARSGLGLIFLNRNWLRSPFDLKDSEKDMVERFGSKLGGVIQALEALDGSLVNRLNRDGQLGWEFAHPTMVEAFAELLRSPELFHHFLAAFPLSTLLRQITCGDVGLAHATVVPVVHYRTVLDRLDEPLPAGLEPRWRARDFRVSFLANRCDREFLRLWLDRHPDIITPPVHVGLMVEAVADNELILRLHQFGLLPKNVRAEVANELVEYCVSGDDTAVLCNDRFWSLLTSAEQRLLKERVLSELLTDLHGAVSELDRLSPSPQNEEEAEARVTPLRDLAVRLPDLYPDHPTIFEIAAELDSLLDDWVTEHGDAEEGVPESPPAPAAASQSAPRPSQRSVFDDLLEAR